MTTIDEPQLLPPELRTFADRAGRLKQWPRRMKLKLLAIAWFATRFEADVSYTERQVNAILQDWHLFNDAPMLRRYLVDLGYLRREPDGSRYWLASPPPV